MKRHNMWVWRCLSLLGIVTTINVVSAGNLFIISPDDAKIHLDKNNQVYMIDSSGKAVCKCHCYSLDDEKHSGGHGPHKEGPDDKRHSGGHGLNEEGPANHPGEHDGTYFESHSSSGSGGSVDQSTGHVSHSKASSSAHGPGGHTASYSSSIARGGDVHTESGSSSSYNEPNGPNNANPEPHGTNHRGGYSNKRPLSHYPDGSYGDSSEGHPRDDYSGHNHPADGKGGYYSTTKYQKQTGESDGPEYVRGEPGYSLGKYHRGHNGYDSPNVQKETYTVTENNHNKRPGSYGGPHSTNTGIPDDHFDHSLPTADSKYPGKYSGSDGIHGKYGHQFTQGEPGGSSSMSTSYGSGNKPHGHLDNVGESRENIKYGPHDEYRGDDGPHGHSKELRTDHPEDFIKSESSSFSGSYVGNDPNGSNRITSGSMSSTETNGGHPDGQWSTSSSESYIKRRPNDIGPYDQGVKRKSQKSGPHGLGSGSSSQWKSDIGYPEEHFGPHEYPHSKTTIDSYPQRRGSGSHGETHTTNDYPNDNLGPEQGSHWNFQRTEQQINGPLGPDGPGKSTSHQTTIPGNPNDNGVPSDQGSPLTPHSKSKLSGQSDGPHGLSSGSSSQWKSDNPEEHFGPHEYFPTKKTLDGYHPNDSLRPEQGSHRYSQRTEQQINGPHGPDGRGESSSQQDSRRTNVGLPEGRGHGNGDPSKSHHSGYSPEVIGRVYAPGSNYLPLNYGVHGHFAGTIYAPTHKDWRMVIKSIDHPTPVNLQERSVQNDLWNLRNRLNFKCSGVNKVNFDKNNFCTRRHSERRSCVPWNCCNSSRKCFYLC